MQMTIIAIVMLAATSLQAGAFIYSPEKKLLAESTSAGTQEYVWLGGIPVAQFDSGGASPVRWTFADHLGAPVVQTGSAGSVLWRAGYEPYGRAVVRAGQSLRQPLRLPGQESDDASSDRVYNVQRWYRPEWGRYSQADPLLNGAPRATRLLDPYAYAFDDPVRRVDPLGLYSVSGFNEQQALEVNLAIKKVWDFLNKRPCCLAKYPYSLLENMRNAMITASFQYDSQDDDHCGHTIKYTNNIFVTPWAFTDSCEGCLALTILHELSHSAGATDLDNSYFFAPSAYQIERECGDVCK